MFNTMTLSDEQETFIEKALEGHNILVDACIGSGKTTSIQELCNRYPKNKRILYLTYSKLLKIDAKNKIIETSNVTVTNYHGFAMGALLRSRIKSSVEECIQNFLKERPYISSYDVLILDEYQDIEQESADMIEIIKAVSPGIQIIAVGDMAQKIFDKTTLRADLFIHKFLGDYIKLEFTKCFRLPKEHAAMLGRIWGKKIEGVNDDCQVCQMRESEIIELLKNESPENILCLGQRTGALARTLNRLEALYPDRFNKRTVYASIRDRDGGTHKAEPTEKAAIFTTYDSAKGLERPICVVFDFTEDYWYLRNKQSDSDYTILRNIFCVAASRGKKMIIFAKSEQKAMLSEKSLSTPINIGSFKDIDISGMFDFKYKEDIEKCYSCLDIEKIPMPDTSVIEAPVNDGLIDISPCVGMYLENMFFRNFSIDIEIALQLAIHEDKKFLYTSRIREGSKETKILFHTSLETGQNRYIQQVSVPFVKEETGKRMYDRLNTLLSPNETVQVVCGLGLVDEFGISVFNVKGYCDVLKDDSVYELKFVSELSRENFLQCACYMCALGVSTGYLWNIRTNDFYKISVPDRDLFLRRVVKTITKGRLDHNEYRLVPWNLKRLKSEAI